MLFLMVSIPKLPSDPKIIAIAETRIERSLDSLANEVLVSIITGAIEMAVSDLNRFMNYRGYSVFIDLPGAQSGRRKCRAIREVVRCHGLKLARFQKSGHKKCQETTAMRDKLGLLRFRPDPVHQPALRGSGRARR